MLMAALSVRVSEDPARPLGHAIVTLSGLPRGLETFEFALSRHGFAANHLGLDGWQGAECWLQPEEAWFSGDVLKFVIHPDLVFQLENMPYQLAVRGQGLTGAATVTFVWPLQLELEEGSDSGERKVVSGTRVNPGPPPRPEPAGAVPAVEPPPLPLPEVGSADLEIPDVPIPDIGAGLEQGLNQDRTRVVLPRSQKPRTRGSASRAETPEVKLPSTEVPIPADEEPTQKALGRIVSLPVAEGTGEATHRELMAQSPNQAEPSRLEPESRSSEPDTQGSIPAPRRGMSGMRVGLLGLAVLAAVLAAVAGWWWFGHQSGGKTSTAIADKPIPPTLPTGSHPTLEPKPAPEP